MSFLHFPSRKDRLNAGLAPLLFSFSSFCLRHGLYLQLLTTFFMVLFCVFLNFLLFVWCLLKFCNLCLRFEIPHCGVTEPTKATSTTWNRENLVNYFITHENFIIIAFLFFAFAFSPLRMNQQTLSLAVYVAEKRRIFITQPSRSTCRNHFLVCHKNARLLEPVQVSIPHSTELQLLPLKMSF